MLVEKKKITNYLVSINNLEDIEKLKKVGVTTFLFALDKYSIGYNTFTVDEINNILEDKYVLVNRLLNTKEIEEFKSIIKDIKCNGIIFEDIGLINVLKEYSFKKILFMNHFNTNILSVNYFLEYVDSVFISNELTYKELKEITDNVNKKVVVHVLGYNQIMYSKRKLLSNFYDYYKLDNKSNNVTLKDVSSDVKFNMIEENDETLVLSEKIFDGRRLLDLSNILYFYINTSYMNIDDVLKFINNEEISSSDEGFLDKATIYKLKGE